MKRTNLVLDMELLEQARHLAGARTYSATVNQALAEMVRMRKIEAMTQAFGRGLWEGDLSEMRVDNPSRRPRTAKGGR